MDMVFIEYQIEGRTLIITIGSNGILLVVEIERAIGITLNSLTKTILLASTKEIVR